MPKKNRIPTYRHHKASGQAVVLLDGKSVYLGVWDSPVSRAKYDRVISEWLVHGRSPVCTRGGPIESGATLANGPTVNELILMYWRFAEGYYKPDGDTTSELRCIREALRPVREMYGSTEAAKFGPLALILQR
jgi:hypothetical protein